MGKEKTAGKGKKFCPHCNEIVGARVGTCPICEKVIPPKVGDAGEPRAEKMKMEVEDRNKLIRSLMGEDEEGEDEQEDESEEGEDEEDESEEDETPPPPKKKKVVK